MSLTTSPFQPPSKKQQYCYECRAWSENTEAYCQHCNRRIYTMPIGLALMDAGVGPHKAVVSHRGDNRREDHDRESNHCQHIATQRTQAVHDFQRWLKAGHEKMNLALAHETTECWSDLLAHSRSEIANQSASLKAWGFLFEVMSRRRKKEDLFELESSIVNYLSNHVIETVIHQLLMYERAAIILCQGGFTDAVARFSIVFGPDSEFNRHISSGMVKEALATAFYVLSKVDRTDQQSLMLVRQIKDKYGKMVPEHKVYHFLPR